MTRTSRAASLAMLVVAVSCTSPMKVDVRAELPPRVAGVRIPKPRYASVAKSERTRFLIVANERYESRELGLPAAGRSANYVQAQLEQHGVSSADIQLMTGDAPTADGVRSRIKELARLPDTESLVVLWIGHGVNAGGERHLLTRDTALAANELGYSDTLSQTVLGQLLTAEETRAAERGRPLTTALLIDACAVNAAGVPGVARETPSGPAIEAVSATSGRAAIVQTATELLPFSEAFAEHFGRTQSLLEAVDSAVHAASESGAAVLARRKDIRCSSSGGARLRLVDESSGAEVPGAEVWWGESLLSELEPGVYDTQGLSSSGALRVVAPGYLEFSTRTQLRGAEELIVPLIPQLMVVKVRAADEDLPYRLSIEGIDAEKWRTHYHSEGDQEVTSDVFELYVPVGSMGRLVATREGEELAVVDLSSLVASETVEVDGHRIPWTSVRMGTAAPDLTAGSVWRGRMAVRGPKRGSNWSSFAIEVSQVDGSSFSGSIDKFGTLLKNVEFNGVITDDGELQAVVVLPPGAHFVVPSSVSSRKSPRRISQIELIGKIADGRWSGITRVHHDAFRWHRVVKGEFEADLAPQVESQP